MYQSQLDPGVPYLSNRQSDRGSDFQPGIPNAVSETSQDGGRAVGNSGVRICAGTERIQTGKQASGSETPEELKELKDQMHLLGEQMEKTVDLDGLLKLAAQAEDIPVAEKKEDLVRKGDQGKGKSNCAKRESPHRGGKRRGILLYL